MMRDPVGTEPVKDTLSTSGWLINGSPASAPVPVSTLSTPGGKPALEAMSASSSGVMQASSDGFSTTVQPAASAGPTFHTHTARRRGARQRRARARKGERGERHALSMG